MKSGGFMYRKKNIKEPKIFKFSFLHGKDVNVITDKEIKDLIDEYINKSKDVFGSDALIRIPNSSKDSQESFRGEGRSLQMCVQDYISDTLSTYIVSLDNYLNTGKDEDAPVIVLDERTLHVFNNDEEFLNVYEEVPSEESESLEDVLKNRNTSDSIISHNDSFWLSEHANSDIYLESLVAKYVLRPDNMSDEDDFQTLTIENVNGGSGDYFRIKTGSDDPKDNIKFISLSDANELSSILKDFEKRLNMFSKVKIS